MNARTMMVELELDVDAPYHVASCTLRESLSTITEAHVELASTEDLDLESALARPAQLTFLLDGVPVRRFTLAVASAGFTGARNGTLHYSVELRAPAFVLALGSDTRKFRDVPVEAILAKVLSGAGVAFDFRTTRATASRSYCVQYHESNLAFVERLLESEGIFYSFEDDGTMVFGDRSGALPSIDGPDPVELIEAAGALDHGALGVHLVRRGAKVTSGKVTVNDFDWKKPHSSILASARSGPFGALEIYDYPVGYRDEGAGAGIASRRLESVRAGARWLEGEGTVVGFAAGRAFSFAGAGDGSCAGEYLLTEVTHRFEDARHAGSSANRTYGNAFRAIPRDVPFRPPLRTPRPTIAGHHTAMVRGPAGEEIHTDRWGRCKVQFHWDREATGTDADSRWIRVLQESASSMFLARVGWEMHVAYIDGDPDRPVGLSRAINGVMPPAYGQPANKNVMTIKTPSSPATGGYNEIKLDDTAGSMRFDVRAERDYFATVENDRSETVGVNKTQRVDGAKQHQVDHDQAVRIGGSHTVTTESSHRQTVGRDRDRVVGGSETIHVGKSYTLDVGKKDVERVASVRLTIDGSIGLPDVAANAKSLVPSGADAKSALTDGAVSGAHAGLSGGAAGALAGGLSGAKGGLQGLLPTPQGALGQLTGGLSSGGGLASLASSLCRGAIDRTGQKSMTRMVGGAYVAAALGSITTTAHYGDVEVVGGVRLAVAARGNVLQSVGGPMTLTVGGVVMRSSKNDMSVAAKSSTVAVGATFDLSSEERVRIVSSGPVQLTAKKKLALESEKLSIVLEPSKASISGDLKMHSKDKIVVSGKDDDITK